MSGYSQRLDTVFYSPHLPQIESHHTDIARTGLNKKEVRLPVIFHIWDNPERTNYVHISDSIIDSQLEALNRDFAPHGIVFQRSIINSSSEPFNGVLRYLVPLHQYDDNGLMSYNYIAGSGGDSRMRQNSQGFSFINFHVGAVRSVLGIAYGDGSMEGLLVTSPVFGIREEQRSYGEGKTGTHETGHWLGLRHTFTGGCEDGPGDEVYDTPPVDVQYGCGWSGCNPYDDTNYMNYHDDRCMDHFTEGQLKRMYSIIMSKNPHIIQSPGAGYLRCDKVTNVTYANDTIRWNESLINISYTVRIRRGIEGSWKSYETDTTMFDIGFIPDNPITYYEVKIKAKCRLYGKTKESGFRKKSFIR